MGTLTLWACTVRQQGPRTKTQCRCASRNTSRTRVGSSSCTPINNCSPLRNGRRLSTPSIQSYPWRWPTRRRGSLPLSNQITSFRLATEVEEPWRTRTRMPELTRSLAWISWWQGVQARNSGKRLPATTAAIRCTWYRPSWAMSTSTWQALSIPSDQERTPRK